MNKPSKPLTGLHVLGEVTTKEVEKLESLNQARKHIQGVVEEHGLHKLGSFYHKFPGSGGFTGLVSLIESHISIHTWPELKYFTLDVYLCNYSRDNSTTAKKVFRDIVAFFGPTKIIKRYIRR